MNSSDKDKAVFRYLLTKSIDGQITPSEIEQLNILWGTYPDLEEYYFDNVLLQYLLPEANIAAGSNQTTDSILSDEFWIALAGHEKTAPTIEHLKEEKQRELIQKVVRPPREKRKVTKFQIFTLVMSTAAILFFVLFIQFAPKRPYAVEAATLVDQMNVQWADSTINFKNGDRLWTNQTPIGLDKGIVNIQYDDGVDVLVEGPAKFAVERSGVYVEYGRLFSRVSGSGLGFMVETPTVRFVDQGTEFGVQADVNGSAELHVIKGKVQLFAGTNGKSKSSQIITENEACRYNVNTGKTETVPIRTEAFVRSIDSKTKQIWHGEKRLKLASIVAGYDGFKEIGSIVGIDPTNGEYTTSIIGKNRTTNNTYNPVMDSDYIDGVCVPDGKLGPIQITSSGLNFNCPDTSGMFTHEIAAYMGSLENQHTTIPPMIKNGNHFEGCSFVFLHSNIGITFDLQTIRNSLPQMELNSFTSEAGLGDIADEHNVPDLPDVDFWILVDGQIRFERKGLKLEDGVISFDVDLSSQDRFLTLIVTDGLRAGDKREFPFGRDGFYLIDPELTLTEMQ